MALHINARFLVSAPSLPERSAVVTRRFEPAMARVLAGFGKVSASDAVLNARLCLAAKKSPSRGQIHSLTVSNTINSEPTNIDK